MKEKDIDNLIIQGNLTVLETVDAIDKGGRGIVFLCQGRKLLFAVADGDIRRYILKNGKLDANVTELNLKSPCFLHEYEKKRACDVADDEYINAIPIVNDDMEIIDIFFRREPNEKKETIDVPVVIMAGGKGTRLYPYTKILPKPLIPIGEIPIVERVMDEFHQYGICKFVMSVNYKKNMIQAYFSDNSNKYEVEYLEEKKPLGTAGSLKLIDRGNVKPIIVANCDSIVKANYYDLLQHHINYKYDITMVVSLKSQVIPYGVIELNANGELDKIVEKPVKSYMINTGMYVINPDIIEYIPDDELFHMTDLIEEVISNGKRIGVYPIGEDSFLDMGEFAEMKRMEQKLNIISEK